MTKKTTLITLLFVALSSVVILTSCALTAPVQPVVSPNTITVDEVNKLLNELQGTGDINLSGRTSSMWNQNGTHIYNDNGGPVNIASTTASYAADLATGAGDLFITDNLEVYGQASSWSDWQWGGLDGGNILLYADVGLNQIAIGTSTPAQLFQVSAPAGNATTTPRFGDDGSSNTVGTCIELNADDGAIYHLWIDGSTLTTSAGACTT